MELTELQTIYSFDPQSSPPKNPMDFTIVLALTNSSGIMSLLWIAGWSSPVARQAHNLKVLGSNPSPATNFLSSAAFVALG